MIMDRIFESQLFISVPLGRDKTGIEKVYKFTTSTIIYKCTEKIGTVQLYMTRFKIYVFVGLRISTEDTLSQMNKIKKISK